MEIELELVRGEERRKKREKGSSRKSRRSKRNVGKGELTILYRTRD